MKKELIIIVGPTAVGKTKAAISVAKTKKTEIISADSRQVYKYMDLGTGKITKKEMRGIPHHLLDVVSPKNKIFSVSDYQKLANKKIKEILKKGDKYYSETFLKSVFKTLSEKFLNCFVFAFSNINATILSI